MNEPRDLEVRHEIIQRVTETCSGYHVDNVLYALTALVVHFGDPHFTVEQMVEELRTEHARQHSEPIKHYPGHFDTGLYDHELSELCERIADVCAGRPLRYVLNAFSSMLVHAAMPHFTVEKMLDELREEYARQSQPEKSDMTH